MYIDPTPKTPDKPPEKQPDNTPPKPPPELPKKPPDTGNNVKGGGFGKDDDGE